ncbi:hypothetical protein [Streptococcus suis]|uniref:hypothetical protein n=1 Tax=Streptococcus suis TaxID=1307 RepID=UPI000CF5D0B0|nr:hypothetical protein [Streptococcus suis]
MSLVTGVFSGIIGPFIVLILALFLALYIDYSYHSLKTNERGYIIFNSLLMVCLFIILIFAWYPQHEGGDKTLFGQKPSYLGQKILEVLVLPIAISFAVYIFERIRTGGKK